MADDSGEAGDATDSAAGVGHSPLAVSQVRQISIRVHDLEGAIAFYRDVLGLAFLARS